MTLLEAALVAEHGYKIDLGFQMILGKIIN
jgi:hypothetical protein